ncbi:hypothetical protein PHRODO_160 [Bacillus phage Phrodo]|uniref:hypothetical protein n=1 Tax=Bacillus phage Phrodo TaxID=1805953 RepID=UPI0007A772DE|nr:hypothetical protein BI003_gp160 [Bacillus phage Phrodo]AMW62201.1 hypothetical protein PHRODO_160 [Bacillus phage Phrodo]
MKIPVITVGELQDFLDGFDRDKEVLLSVDEFMGEQIWTYHMHRIVGDRPLICGLSTKFKEYIEKPASDPTKMINIPTLAYDYRTPDWVVGIDKGESK